jgi:putative DNA primase/helicase
MQEVSIKKYIKYYIRRKLKVFPCKGNGKSPRISGWQESATLDEKVIDRWWEKYPNANIGLLTGKNNNLVVVDVDINNGKKGMESLKQLQNECGEFDTLMVHSPSGGRHYYFKYPKNEDHVKGPTNFRPGIDIRADGNLIIAPGSSIDGNPYRFEDGEKEISELPDRLLEMLMSKEGLPMSPFEVPISDVIYGIEEGGRNEGIYKYACSLRGIDTPYNEAVKQVRGAAKSCIPPLSDQEATACLNSAWKHEPNTEGFHLTELGNAKRLVEMYGDDIRYVVEYKKWIYWDGCMWKEDMDGYIERLAKDTVLSIYEEAFSEADMNRRRDISSHAMKSESKYVIDAMIKLTKSEKSISISQSRLDNNNMLLGVNNGALDLSSGSLLMNSKKFFITQKANVSYMPEEKCPLWMSFLETVTGGDEDMISYLKKIVGYSLTGKTSEQALFFFYGFGANGKGVWIDTIEFLLGSYAKKTSVKTLMAKKTSGADDNLARLRGARYVTTSETEEGARFDESLLKTLTGEDRITARQLYGSTFEYLPEFKIFVVGNHKPYIKGNDFGIWRRLKLIPFDITIPNEERDGGLRENLKKTPSIP